MHYARGDAKAHARANLTGIWAAALTPFTSDLRLDEDGFRENVRHWTEDLQIAGLFVCGKQGEFFSMSVSGAQGGAWSSRSRPPGGGRRP